EIDNPNPFSTPYTTLKAAEVYFLGHLQPEVDILEVYNDDWEDTGSQYLPKETNAGQGRGDKAKKMEIAVNDVLNSLFNISDSDNDDTGTPGLYKMDFDGDNYIQAGFSWTKTNFGATITNVTQLMAELDSTYHSNGAIATASGTAHPSKTVGQTNATNSAWGDTPELFVGKSSYYYIIVRSQIGKTSNDLPTGTWSKTLSEKNMAAVVYIYNDGSTKYKLLYKRWFTR
ncbi:MAG: hypothetical protein ACYTFY_02300, partial [Planctomycetota bacterium]